MRVRWAHEFAASLLSSSGPGSRALIPVIAGSNPASSANARDRGSGISLIADP